LTERALAVIHPGALNEDGFMTFEKRNSEHGSVAVLTGMNGAIEDAGDFLDVMAGGASDVLVIDGDRLTPGFFDLKSGILGEILQKASNYRRKIVILGDFDGPPPGAFADFVRESNRGGTVVFAPDADSGLAMLR
jgi:hypothetical protein